MMQDRLENSEHFQFCEILQNLMSQQTVLLSFTAPSWQLYCWMEPTGVGINVPIKQNSMTRGCPHEWIVLHWRTVHLVTGAASIACGHTINKD